MLQVGMGCRWYWWNDNCYQIPRVFWWVSWSSCKKIKYAFCMDYFCQFILLFNFFLLLFISLTVFFGTIHESHCNISVNFYLYLPYFQQNIFNFRKNNWIPNARTCGNCASRPNIFFFDRQPNIIVWSIL